MKVVPAPDAMPLSATKGGEEDEDRGRATDGAADLDYEVSLVETGGDEGEVDSDDVNAADDVYQ